MEPTLKAALVLGATGGLGNAVARRLVADGWKVRALHRNPEGIKEPGPFTWIQGDALNPQDVKKAADGAPFIVHAVKPRNYRDWHKYVLPMIDNTIAAADGARIVLPGNVYNYGPDAGAVIAENALQHPITTKGQLRVELERRIARAVEAGKAKALILRAGDFFGPGAGSSWFSEAMVRPGHRPRKIYNPGTPGVGHQWAYLPDIAETMVRLMEHAPLADLARFHMEGHWDSDGTQMAAAIVGALGAPAVRIAKLPWWALSLAAPFRPDFKELLELRYLWQRPVRLDNKRLVATLGVEPHTPLTKAVHATLEAILM